MLDKIKEFIANNKVAQFILIFIVGAAIGAIFYPTKHLEETLTKKHQEEIVTLNEQHSKEVKTEREKYDALSGSYKSLKTESESKLTSLSTQIHTLQSKQKTSYYKIVRPDGTIEIKKFSETDTDESSKVVTQIQQEFKQKVDSIEQKWSVIHKERVVEMQKEFDAKEQAYKKTIDEMKYTKVEDINKKSFGIEAGVLIDRSYYGHVTYDVFGPVFLGGHAQFGLNNTLGLGLGLRL